jgi:hypothetical protein
MRQRLNQRFIQEAQRQKQAALMIQQAQLRGGSMMHNMPAMAHPDLQAGMMQQNFGSVNSNIPV